MIDTDKLARARVANELDRREFWRDVFLQYFAYSQSAEKSALAADKALEEFSLRFGSGPAR